MFVCCECCVLSGRGLCDGLITRPEKSYRILCVVVCDLEISWIRRPWPTEGCRAKRQYNNYSIYVKNIQSPLNKITPFSKVFLKKLIFVQSWRRFFSFHTDQRFFTSCKITHPRMLYWSRQIRSIFSCPLLFSRSLQPIHPIPMTCVTFCNELRTF